MRYWRFFKIYVMPLWQLKLLDKFLTVVLWYYDVEKVIINLPHLIITPEGIQLNRRHTRRFVPVERRFINILRYKLSLWLYDNDDTNPA